MPKKRNKKKNIAVAAACQDLDEIDGDSVVSENSVLSEVSNITESDSVIVENPIKKIEELIDTLSENSKSLRETVLCRIIKIFQKTYISIDNSWNYFETFYDTIERIIRKGKETEKYLACNIFLLYLVNIDKSDLSQMQDKIVNTFEPIYKNPSESLGVRKTVVKIVSLCLLWSFNADAYNIKKTMDILEHIFKGSCLKGDGNLPNVSSELNSLHICALDNWCMLYTILPSSLLSEVVNSIINRLYSLLKSQFVDMRISVGVCIAVIFERMRKEVNPKFKGNAYPEMVELLEQLSRDGTKSRAKNERKKQRHSFRDILTAIQSDDVMYPTESVKLNKFESIELVSWCHKIYYEIFCTILETGVVVHLSENDSIRTLFDLGDPVEKVNVNKLSHKQRHLANQANSKLLKQTRQFNRNKRMAANNIDDD